MRFQTLTVLFKNNFYVNKMKHEYDNNENERVSNTHSKGERVKILLLPSKVGKRSRTMTMVTTLWYIIIE